MQTYIIKIYDSKYTIAARKNLENDINSLFRSATKEEAYAGIFYNVYADANYIAHRMHEADKKSLWKYITDAKRFNSEILKIGCLNLPVFNSEQDANEFKQFIDATFLLAELKGQ